MILGTSTKLDYAAESWRKARDVLEAVSRKSGDPLYGRVPRARKSWIRETNGEQQWSLGPSRYKIAASNAEGGRSLTIDRLILDELRQHHSRDAWAASVPATTAVPDSQIWALSNAGDDRSEVLNSERAAALSFIETGVGDPGVGIFEWSAPDDADPLDPDAHAAANPQLGRRIVPDRLMGQARTAVGSTDPKALTTFRTESLCQRVRALDTAIDPASWARCLDPGSMADYRSRTAVVIDVAPDLGHVTVYAAAVLPDGRTRIDPVAAWSDRGCVSQAEHELRGIIERVRPKVIGWFPRGPGAVLAAKIRRPGRADRWPPPGVTVAEITADTASVCMALSEAVTAGTVVHSGDALLDDQVATAERVWSGDTWRYARRGAGHVDAVYAAAGAVHLARLIPDASGRQRVVMPVARS